MVYIGIDPGMAGGIAFIDETGAILNAVKMPETEKDLFELLTTGIASRLPGTCGPWHATIERVHSSPQMGVVSAFKFGRGVGVLHMALIAADIPFDEVTPHTWQKAMGCLQVKRVEFGTKDKNITKRRAQALFPKLTKITHAIADALLIAEYARRLHSRGLFDGKEGKEGKGSEESQGFLTTEIILAEAGKDTAPAAAGATAGRRRRSRQQGDRQRSLRLR